MYPASAKKETDCEEIYNKYAPAIFGTISSLTDDKAIAEEIFIAFFLKIADNQFNLTWIPVPLAYILRSTYGFAMEKLEQLSLIPKTHNNGKEGKLIYLLCRQCNSLKDAAIILNITEEEVRELLRFEFSEFRKQTG